MKNSIAFNWLISLLVFFVLWDLFIRVFFNDSNYVFGPIEIVASYESVFENGLIEHTYSTLKRTFLGFFLASILGVLFGVLFGKSKILHRLFSPLIDLARPIPSAALIPIVMLLPTFGFQEKSYLTIIVYGSIWPILINTIDAVRNIDTVTSMSIKQIKISPIEKFYKLTLAEAFPGIITGMQISLSISLILAITAEMLVGRQDGLGHLMQLLDDGGKYKGMYFCILILAFIGLNTDIQKK